MRWLWIAAIGLLGCSASPLAQVARSGDRDAFRSALDARLQQGEEIGGSEAQEIALEFAVREVDEARADLGRQALFALRPCAKGLDAALERRAAGDDEVGGWAAFLRADAGRVPAAGYAAHLGSVEPAWRAAAVRTLGFDGGSQDARHAAVWRERLLRDPAASVREAAALAVTDALDIESLPMLMEAARLDPDADLRALAIAALGRLGRERAVLALVDLWPDASEDDRLAIARAWASSASRDVGGQAQLVRALARSDGLVAVSLAVTLIGEEDPDGGGPDAQAAAVVLARLLRDGASRVRTRATEQAPLAWPALREAVDEAEASPDDPVAVAALARLAESAPAAERAARLARLREYAQRDTPAGRAAAEALAHMGDEGALEPLARLANSASRSERIQAGKLYLAMGERRRALRLLADPDARVRAAVACAVLEPGS